MRVTKRGELCIQTQGLKFQDVPSIPGLKKELGRALPTRVALRLVGPELGRDLPLGTSSNYSKCDSGVKQVLDMARVNEL